MFYHVLTNAAAEVGVGVGDGLAFDVLCGRVFDSIGDVVEDGVYDLAWEGLGDFVVVSGVWVDV